MAPTYRKARKRGRIPGISVISPAMFLWPNSTTSLSLWILATTLFLACPCSTLDPPTIVPGGDTITVAKGENLELMCHGDEPVEWSFTNFDLENTSRVQISHFQNASEARKYSARLEITNVQNTDASEILCGYETKNSTSEDEAFEARILLYVEDEDNLLIEPQPKNPQPYYTIHAKKIEVVVPCRTSWPAVNIAIYNASDSDRLIPLNSTNYSILKGLTIYHASGSLAKYICKATYKNRSATIEWVVFPQAPDAPVTANWMPHLIKGPSVVAAGSGFQVLCETRQEFGLKYVLNLVGPTRTDQTDDCKNNSVRVRLCRSTERQGTKVYYSKTIVISNATKDDAGNYTCTLEPTKPRGPTRPKSMLVQVFEKGESFLDAYAQLLNISVPKHHIAKWVFNVTSFPLNHSFSWKGPKGQEIQFGTKYQMKNTKPWEYLFSINTVTLDDMGPYPLTITVPGFQLQRTLKFYLTVKMVPEIAMEPKDEYLNCPADSVCSVSCHVKASPPANITWKWQPCSSSTVCDLEKVVNETERREKNQNREITSIVRFSGQSHGRYTCYAMNGLIKDPHKESKFIRIVDPDFRGSKNISILVHPEELVVRDDVELTCAVSKLDVPNDGNLTWFRENETVQISPELTKLSETKWSRRNTLLIPNITKAASGTYHCRVDGSSKTEEMKHLSVLDEAVPKLTTNLTNNKMDLKLGDTLELVCNASGKPKPNVTWTLDEIPVSDWPSNLKYEFREENTILLLKYVPKEGEGVFKCTAKNRPGIVTAFLDIRVIEPPRLSGWMVALFVALIIVLICLGIFLARYKYQQGEMRRFLKEIRQKDFYEGAVENINPDLGVTDQAYLLPFDNCFEFPKDRLKFSIQLGSGAFGRVVKAEAFGILESESKTTVAVKMVKPNADDSHFKALMSELKIMVHLGKHINVVNLLGACTKNLAKKKELFVIVEYCKYGSLLSYMLKHRRTFINQLDPARGVIDPSIYRPIDRSSEMSAAQRLHYAQLTFTDPGNSRPPASNGYRTLEEFNGPNPEDPQSPNTLELVSVRTDGEYLTPNRRSTEHYVPDSHAESAMTGMTYLSNSNGHTLTDGTTKRRSSCGSQWQDHYRGDYQVREVQPIKTTDLLCWAFQIARGMEYLASRKVLHGDLAARNVLLAENNVVKICDFGLAKDIYKNPKYKKQSEGTPLPVKWMAIESIFYGVFSTQSDCWSFGVVLWELFTLGKTPYPGMEIDDRFYKRINEGYRMEKPPLAPSCVYDIMLECWNQDAAERPTFLALADRIGDMMTEGLRNHYIDLNAEYMRINQTYMAGRTDYLLKMGQTDFNSGYQNMPEDEAGYLKPIPFSAQPPTSSTGTGMPHYQNVDPSRQEQTVVAVNNGYQFINRQPSSPEDATSQSFNQASPQPQMELHINSPDIQDMSFNFRDSSTSPDRNSDPIIIPELQDSHVDVHVGQNGIRGVDNMNYVPNYMLFNKNHKMSSQMEPNPTKVSNGTGANNCSGRGGENNRRQKRQKNDSGLGSIDSSHFDQGKCNSQDGHYLQYSEMDKMQNSNGYVTHQNITSLS